MSSISEIVLPWLQREEYEELGSILDQVNWLSEKLFNDYEPNQFESFDDRFAKWIGNVHDEKDRQTLFKILGRIFFVGRSEFASLCRASFNGPMTRWLVELLNVPIDAQNAGDLISAGLRETWFCPITDSMRINAFLKINNLEGKQHRPDWRSLAKFGDPAKVASYVESNNISRLVLLEDFVGSGTQMRRSVDFLGTNFPQIPTLLSPLVCCPGGVVVGDELAQKYPNVTFSPVLVIRSDRLVSPVPQPGEHALYSEIRDLTERVKDRFSQIHRGQPYGFKDTGALVVIYSNCPNNTLPIIHDQSGEWKAIFPRVRRN